MGKHKIHWGEMRNVKNESEKAHGPWHPRVIGGQWAGEKNLRFDRTGKGKRKEQWHDEVGVVRCDDY